MGELHALVVAVAVVVVSVAGTQTITKYRSRSGTVAFTVDFVLALQTDSRGPIYKESYDNLTINLRQIVNCEHLTTNV